MKEPCSGPCPFDENIHGWPLIKVLGASGQIQLYKIVAGALRYERPQDQIDRVTKLYPFIKMNIFDEFIARGILQFVL